MLKLLDRINSELLEGKMLETTGERLAAVQRDKGLNGKEVTDYLRSYGIEIDPSHYSRIMNNKALPSVQVLKALAQVLGCTTDYILCLPWADDPNPSPAPDVFMAPEANEVGNIMDQMDEDVRRHVLHMATAMLRMNEERRELHGEIAELLEEQIVLLSGQKRQKVESLLGRL